ncbi:MAG TPA: hypothetical protein VNS32_13950 [Flavisolibacter sp.]|nr:hypothetical protein [Flavisolibacter sp.]
MNITDMIQFSDEKPAIVQIKSSEHSQVIAIGLKKGQVLKKHVTTVPAFLIVLKGSIQYEKEHTKTQVQTLSTFEIPAHEPHEVLGLEDSIFLLIREKP